MSNETEKKDDLGPTRKVLLYTQMINYMAYGLERLNDNFATVLYHDPESPLKHAKAEQDKILRYTVDQLSEVANRLANFLDGCDGLDDTDLAILNPVFELLTPEK
jgi:hypothetical protein